jgi:alkanesulfonate monooxygenase SsuD/methylene tetrahydromethanopterin reductase-like flavin-dependent oxidoreductase (luciferase family)
MSAAHAPAHAVLAANEVRFGCVAPSKRADVARLEAAGAASLWVGGHLASPNPSPEALGWLARLSEQTETAIIGTAVLLLPLYPPALVAKLIADLDNASGGRLALGVGVGGEYPSEFDAVQVPLASRGARTDESIGLLRQWWTGEPVTAGGPHFPVTDVRIHPAPAQRGGPPIIVAGRKPVAMRRAAALGDGWMPYLYSPERYRQSVDTITAEASAAGRSLDEFGWLAYLPICVDADGDLARRHAAEFLGGTYRQDFAAFIDRVAVAGTPGEVTARLQAFVDAGARHLILLPAVREHGTDMLMRVLSEIVPLIRYKI